MVIAERNQVYEVNNSEKKKMSLKGICVSITELKKPTHIGRSHGFGVPDL
jgi:hypothetical protein